VAEGHTVWGAVGDGESATRPNCNGDSQAKLATANFTLWSLRVPLSRFSVGAVTLSRIARPSGSLWMPA
jgi:hypothetical protein